MEKEEIKDWLNFQEIKKSTIKKDKDGNFFVDVNGDVVLTNLSVIPVKFGKVTGNFSCAKIGLKTLLNAPEYVSGDFNCSNNFLYSLEHGPKYVDGSFLCMNNALSSLYGSPERIGGNFNCAGNKLLDLKYSPKYIGGICSVYDNLLISLSDAPEEIIKDFDCGGNILNSIEDLKSIVGGKIMHSIYIDEKPLQYFENFYIPSKNRKDMLVLCLTQQEIMHVLEKKNLKEKLENHLSNLSDIKKQKI